MDAELTESFEFRLSKKERRMLDLIAIREDRPIASVLRRFIHERYKEKKR
jgi:hypothetical protein